MAEYKIVSAVRTGEYDTKFGKMIKYAVQFENEADGVEMSQKPETPAPAAGSTVSGTIENTQYGKRFKKEQKFGGSGGGQAGPVSNDKHIALAQAAVTLDVYFKLVGTLNDVARFDKEFPKTIKEFVNLQNSVARLHMGFLQKSVGEIMGNSVVQQVQDVIPGAEEVEKFDGAKAFDDAINSLPEV